MQRYSYLLQCIYDDKRFEYVKINSVNPLYLIFGKVNWCFKEINKNKYLALVTTNENKVIISRNSDDYDEKYIKIKFTSVDE